MNASVLLRAGWILCLFLIQLHPLSADGIEIHPPRMKPMLNKQAVTAYPNPFDDYTTLTYKPEETGFVRIALYSSQGNLVGEIYNDLVDGGSVYQFRLTGEELDSGVYWCSIETNKEIVRQRLEIIR